MLAKLRIGLLNLYQRCSKYSDSELVVAVQRSSHRKSHKLETCRCKSSIVISASLSSSFNSEASTLARPSPALIMDASRTWFSRNSILSCCVFITLSFFLSCFVSSATIYWAVATAPVDTAGPLAVCTVLGAVFGFLAVSLCKRFCSGRCGSTCGPMLGGLPWLGLLLLLLLGGPAQELPDVEAAPDTTR